MEQRTEEIQRNREGGRRIRNKEERKTGGKDLQIEREDRIEGKKG